MAVVLTQLTVPFEVASRWEQGTPGGYLEGHLLLPPCRQPGDALHLGLRCVDSAGAPHPCMVQVVYFKGRQREKCRSTGLYLDLAGGVREETKLEVVRRELVVPGLGKIVARLVGEEGGWRVNLGRQEGSLSLAIIQPLTKGRKGDKVEVQRAIKETRLRVQFVMHNAEVVTATSELIIKDCKQKCRKRKVVNESAWSSDWSEFAVLPLMMPPSQSTTSSITALSDPTEIPIPPSSPWVFPVLSSWDVVAPAVQLFEAHKLSEPSDVLKPTMDADPLDAFTDIPILDFDLLRELEEEEDHWEPLPRQLNVYSLLEVLAGAGIFDFNMEKILNKIRVTGEDRLFDTFGWTFTSFADRPLDVVPERLVLHRYL